MDETKPGYLPQPVVGAQFTEPVWGWSEVNPLPAPLEMCIGWMSVRFLTPTFFAPQSHFCCAVLLGDIALILVVYLFCLGGWGEGVCLLGFSPH